MLSWASRFNICCFLDNHEYGKPVHGVECLVGVDAVASLSADAGDAFERLAGFAATHRVGGGEWLFGHFGYGLARETEPLEGRDAVAGKEEEDDQIGFADLFFFVPAVVIELGKDFVRIGAVGRAPEGVWEEVLREKGGEKSEADELAPVRSGFSRAEYLETVGALRQHILRGDCYEINFCQEFWSQPARIDPPRIWGRLSEVSPNPFSAFYRVGESHLLCASPERFLRRTGDVLSSQPIKGTSPRVPGDPAADAASRDQLYRSAKDRSENVMVVDLVRNDLSRICMPDSVRVTELYGIYSFPHVHQMISTIEGTLPPGVDFATAVKACFPMGSMTGAPKRRVVELIRQYERSRRGIFSGAVGYVRPDGDFDFNVVIRSILYNDRKRYLAWQVGSGITFYSDPVQEYEECMLKAEGMKRALNIG